MLTMVVITCLHQPFRRFLIFSKRPDMRLDPPVIGILFQLHWNLVSGSLRSYSRLHRDWSKRSAGDCQGLFTLDSLKGLNATRPIVSPHLSGLELGGPMLEESERKCLPSKSSAAPIHERSLCRFHWRLNFDPSGTRIPAAIPEAVCHCRRVPPALTNGIAFECQPLALDHLVYHRNVECGLWEAKTIKIVLGCVPIPQASTQQMEILSAITDDLEGAT